ncbi:MAG: NADPH-dependent FMN reductase [Planctomycetota bacterium]
MTPTAPLKIIAIGGGVRPDDYTMRALRVVVDQLERTEGVEVQLVDPVTIEWPAPGLDGGGPELLAFQEAVRAADGVILASPEYHGSISSVLKRIIENLGYPNGLAGKPVAMLGVAAGVIGAIQTLGQLRGIISHVGGLPLPGAVSVPKVQEVFDEAGNCTDEGMEKFIRGLADGLVRYLRDPIPSRASSS